MHRRIDQRDDTISLLLHFYYPFTSWGRGWPDVTLPCFLSAEWKSQVTHARCSVQIEKLDGQKYRSFGRKNSFNIWFFSVDFAVCVVCSEAQEWWYCTSGFPSNCVQVRNYPDKRTGITRKWIRNQAEWPMLLSNIEQEHCMHCKGWQGESCMLKSIWTSKSNKIHIPVHYISNKQSLTESTNALDCFETILELDQTSNDAFFRQHLLLQGPEKQILSLKRVNMHLHKS